MAAPAYNVHSLDQLKESTGPALLAGAFRRLAEFKTNYDVRPLAHLFGGREDRGLMAAATAMLTIVHSKMTEEESLKSEIFADALDGVLTLMALEEVALAVDAAQTGASA